MIVLAPDSSSAVDLVLEGVRALIRVRGMAVGDPLPGEVELASTFGVSRNTVREAIRILRTYGVVESRPKIGTIIADRRDAALMEVFSFAIDLSAETFGDIQGYRRLVEGGLFDLVRDRLEPGVLDRMASLNQDMVEASDPLDAADLDYRFHAELVNAAGNRTLSATYQTLKPVIRSVMEIGKAYRSGVERAAAEHAEILEALGCRNGLAFAFHMDRHLRAGLVFMPPEIGA